MEDVLLFTQYARYFVVYSNGITLGIYDILVDKPNDIIHEKSQTYTGLTWKYVGEPVKIKTE
jgi:hypothetical protein